MSGNAGVNMLLYVSHDNLTDPPRFPR
jgi:hypothetical protein